MSNDGTVHRLVVETVLESHSVDLYRMGSNNSAQTTVMIKGGIVIALVMPERVSRKTLHYLKRKFNVPIHHFYNPEMAPKNGDVENAKGQSVQ